MPLFSVLCVCTLAHLRSHVCAFRSVSLLFLQSEYCRIICTSIVYSFNHIALLISLHYMHIGRIVIELQIQAHTKRLFDDFFFHIYFFLRNFFVHMGTSPPYTTHAYRNILCCRTTVLICLNLFVALFPPLRWFVYNSIQSCFVLYNKLTEATSILTHKHTGRARQREHDIYLCVCALTRIRPAN